MATQKIYTRTDEEEKEYYEKRERAQKMNFQKIEELLQRDPSNSYSKTYTEYTRDELETYISSPLNNIDNLRDISQYLTRVSMLYNKILNYYATMPLYTYNITPIADFSGDFDAEKTLKNYETVVKQMNTFKMFKELSNIVYCTLRDGMYVGFMYNSEEDGMFFMPLDIEYCRIWGKSSEGEWIVYFNAAYFDQSNNTDYLYGIDDDGIGTWDPVFVEGYEAYKNDRNYQWFQLTPELTFCMIAGSDDQFYCPLPYFLPLFKSLLQLIDTEDIVAAKTELQNYKLILNKIPLLGNTDDIDDFAVSLELIMKFQQLLENIVPDQVGVGITPCDVEVVEFEESTSTDDTDEVSTAINNLFANAGINQLVVSSGSSTNATGLKYSIANDKGTLMTYLSRIESWLNYYIKHNVAEGFHMEIFLQTQYNEDDFIQAKKDAATLGGSKTDYLCSLGDTPATVYSKLKFEQQVLNIRQYMEPLESTYTQSSSDNEVGRPEEDVEDLSPEGEATRDSDKNITA